MNEKGVNAKKNRTLWIDFMGLPANIYHEIENKFIPFEKNLFNLLVWKLHHNEAVETGDKVHQKWKKEAKNILVKRLKFWNISFPFVQSLKSFKNCNLQYLGQIFNGFLNLLANPIVWLKHAH